MEYVLTMNTDLKFNKYRRINDTLHELYTYIYIKYCVVSNANIVM
jgi:hypothetical protein